MSNTQPSPGELAWMAAEGLTPLRATAMTSTEIESLRDQMIEAGVRPLVARHWAAKKRALITIDRVTKDIERRRKEAWAASIVYKTFDPEEHEQRRKRWRQIKARAQRILSRES